MYAEVKSSLCVNGRAGADPRIVTLSLDGSDWSPSHSGHFTPNERALGTH